MAVTLATFQTRFPQFAATDPVLVELILAEALARINPTWHGARADNAQAYLAAHLLEMTSGPRGSGVASVSAGQASISYWATSVVEAEDLLLTSYGRLYLKLIKLQGPAMQLI
jgi:hypothetical protein